MFDLIGVATISSAVEAYQRARLEAVADQRLRQAERDREQWEDETLLPLMSAEGATAFLAERRRLRERREDIARQERMHRERLAVENRKASALERKPTRSDFALGFIAGTMSD